MWLEAGLEEPGANLNAGAVEVVAEAYPFVGWVLWFISQ